MRVFARDCGLLLVAVAIYRLAFPPSVDGALFYGLVAGIAVAAVSDAMNNPAR